MKLTKKIIPLGTAIIAMNLFIFDSSLAKEADKIPDKSNLEISSNKPVSFNSGFADIVEDLLPAVVNISTTQEIKSTSDANQLMLDLPKGSIFDDLKDLLEKQQQQQPQSQKRKISSLGSGFIISKDGYVVTNNHVIDGADEVTIGLNDGTKHKAKIIGVDKKTDLALLKINTTTELKYVKLGDSNKSRIGEWLIVVGNPFGLGSSVSVGILSARGRDINAGQIDDFLQTDAAINKGNSGGPLFNTKGEVIGIATAIYSPSGGNVGIGFATPASIAIQVIKQLKEQGQVTRGWLGVAIQDISKEMADSINMGKVKGGAFVTEVIKDSPAEKAGIVATDIIVKFDGQDIGDMKALPKIVSKTPIGTKVKVEIIRQGKTKTLTAKVQLMKDDAKNDQLTLVGKNTKATEYLLGMGLADLDKKIKEENKIDSKINGILVTDIKAKTPAFENDVQTGDIILSVNQIPVKSISDLKKIIEDSKKSGKTGIFIFIKRGEGNFSTVLSIK